MITNQYKMTVMNSKQLKFQPIVTVINPPGKKKSKSMKVLIEGPSSEKRDIIEIAKELELFIKKELQNIQPPKEKMQQPKPKKDK